LTKKAAIETQQKPFSGFNGRHIPITLSLIWDPFTNPGI